MRTHTSDKETWMQRFLQWRQEHISEKQFILILSFLVGICTAGAALFLKGLIHLIQNFLTDHFDATSANWLYLIYPAVGIFLTMLFIRYVVRDDISHGVTKILYAISQKKARIKGHNMYSSVIASALTIGFGGSVGAEAPIVLTGSAIGSNLGQFFHIERRKLMLLVGCGAAGAIAGIFKAPIAGLVFTIEVLMIDLTMSSLLPLMVSCITAATVSYIFTGTEAMFEFNMDAPFEMERIPHVILLGILCGLVSLYFTRMMNRCENMFRRFAQRPYMKLLIGGVMLSILIFLFPPLYGEGYESLHQLLNGGVIDFEGQTILAFFTRKAWSVPIFFLLILLLKVFSMSFTNAGGGVGGTFGPTLFIGAIAGFVVSRTINLIGGGAMVPEQNFVLVGMAGLMAGVMQAPMTAIFLIAEISGGYELLIPLILTATISYGATRMVEPYSIYTKRIAKKGELLTHDSDQAVLTLLKTSDLVESDFKTVRIDATLGELVQVVAKSKRNIFPVLDSQKHFQGYVSLEDIRRDMFKTELHDTQHVYNYMKSAPAYVYVDEKMDSVMGKFETTGAWNLPVVEQDRTYVGFVSKSKIFSAYRDQLKQVSHD